MVLLTFEPKTLNMARETRLIVATSCNQADGYVCT